MKKFIYKVLLFSLPVLMFFSVPVVILKVTGESYTNLDKIIKDKVDYLVGYAYNESNYRYLKFEELKTRNPQTIVALGSSRILQFREKMFDSTFYNAGYTIESISDFEPFLKENFNEKRPKVLLVALDQWMFNRNWDSLPGYGIKKKEWKCALNKRASITSIWDVWTDLFHHKYGLGVLTQQNNIKTIGLNATVNHTGFRKDGSMYYGKQIGKLLIQDSTSEDYNFSDTYSRIKQGNQRFQYGNQIDDRALSVLNDFLAYAKSMGIYIVAIIPPFANKVNQELHDNGKYQYMDTIYPASARLFKKFGFELWDMTNLKKYGSSDQEAIDGFHGGEVSYLRMLIYMIEHNSVLKQYTNIQKLKTDLINQKNPYQVYGD